MTPQPLVQVAVAKTPKYATRESGDTVEIVERPHGGLSAVLADGQRSGKSAKNISNLVVRKAISLLAEGVRDGAVARATHDYLRTYRRGQVSAELQIVSLDLDSYTLLVSRNCRCPAWIRTASEVMLLDETSQSIGIHRNTRPAISEILIEVGITVVVASDGIWQAGRSATNRMDLPELILQTDPQQGMSADDLARHILRVALELDAGRAQDDLTVVVVKTRPRTERSEARYMTIDFPIA